MVEIADPFKDTGKVAAVTLAAMRAGASIIYQATFLDGVLVGHADFLHKVETTSALGNHIGEYALLGRRNAIMSHLVRPDLAPVTLATR